MEKIKINVIRVRNHDFAYVKINDNIVNMNFSNYIVNLKTPEKTFCSEWYKVEFPIETVKRINKKDTYSTKVLLKPASSGLNLASELNYDEVIDGYDYEIGQYEWKDEYSHLSSLYEIKSFKNEVEDKIEELQFDIDVIMEVDEDISDPSNIKFTGITKYKDYNIIFERDLFRETLDEIVYPNIIVRSSKPVMLTSRQVYEIIRYHIKTYIDNRVARVSSDYDFCFSVEKIIETEPRKVLYTDIVKSGRGSKTILKEKMKSDRSIIIFAMTSDDNPHKGYPIIPAIAGKNPFDLEEKINRFLKEIMDIINSKTIECKHCSGHGVIFSKTDYLKEE